MDISFEDDDNDFLLLGVSVMEVFTQRMMFFMMYNTYNCVFSWEKRHNLKRKKKTIYTVGKDQNSNYLRQIMWEEINKYSLVYLGCCGGRKING